MPNCPYCGQKLAEPPGRYCTNCQRELPESISGPTQYSFCPSCGARAQSGAAFCQNCGASLKPGTSAQPPSSPNLEVLVENLRKSSSLRERTDRIISRLWILLPVASGAVAIAFASLMFITFRNLFTTLPSPGTSTPPSTINPFPFNLATFGALEGASLLPGLLFLYFLYLLIKRRNQHFDRQNRLFYDLALTLNTMTSSSKIDPQQTGVAQDFNYMNAAARNSQEMEREKSAVLWVVLLIVPIVNIFAFLYILYFLTNDFQRHEKNEDAFLGKASNVLGGLGVKFSYQREAGKIHYHSFWIYLLLSIVTLGVFELYWFYILITGPNKHFKNQVKIEDDLLASISSR